MGGRAGSWVEYFRDLGFFFLNKLWGRLGGYPTKKDNPSPVQNLKKSKKINLYTIE